MTMRELAKLANVSISTVSKAFHDADDVSEETKKLIFAERLLNWIKENTDVKVINLVDVDK